MSDPRKGWKVQVGTELPGCHKLRKFVFLVREELPKLKNSEDLIALGLIVKLLIYTMRDRDTGILTKLGADEIAWHSGWDGPPAEAFVKALLDCGKTTVSPDAAGFLELMDGTYAIHEWALWQNDPEGQRQKWRNYRAAKKSAGKGPGEPGAKDAGEEIVRQVKQAMTASKIMGNPQQKIEHIEGWRARGIKGDKILEVISKNPGLHIFELHKVLVGPNGTPGSTPKTMDIGKKFVDEMMNREKQ